MIDLIKSEINRLLDCQADIIVTKNTVFGDYSVNINRLEKKINPTTLISNIFEKIEEKSGFINFFVNQEYLLKNLEQGARLSKNSKEKYLVEFGQPNTHKLPHIGHLFSYIYGQSLSLILENQGYGVARLNYQGDIGLHVAKCLYVVNQKMEQVNLLSDLNEKINFLQECYQEGSGLYETDENAKTEINKINTQIYESDPKIMDLWTQTREWSLTYYSQFEKKLGIAYDKSYFESSTFPIGKQLVEKNIPNIFEKSEGAVIFNGEKHDVHTRVFINSQGNPTYEAKDVGLMQQKISDFEFDKCIVTTANEQNDYWKVIKKVSELLFPQIENKIVHLGFGMISLMGQKMSSREGKILSAFSLIDLITNKILENFPNTDSQIVSNLALSSIRYSFLKSEAKKNIIFDVDESISLSGNSGIYLQYTHARCSSLLNEVDLNNLKIAPNYNFSKSELDLIRHFLHLEFALENAARLYSPHIICNYLYELAKKFSVFYEQVSVLKSEPLEKNSRLFLVYKTQSTISQLLKLLGISSLNKI